MLLNFKQTNLGLRVKVKDNSFNLSYPAKIWSSFPSKDFLFDNLAFLSTMSMPLILRAKEMQYNTSKPYFQQEFIKAIRNEIPSAADDQNLSAKKVLSKFNAIKFKFKDNKIKTPPKYSFELSERATVPFSCGKDSLLTLAVSHELGLKPVIAYINDTVSPSENKIKLKYTKKIAKKFNFKCHIIKNEIEQLNDFEFWDKPETTLGYSHMMLSFAFTPLPVAHEYKTKYIFLGNEQNLNASFKTKEGATAYPSPYQTPKGTIKINQLIKKVIPGIHLGSLIEPLMDLAIIKILHTRYKQFGKYQVSCHSLDISRQPRWCQKHSVCADTYLNMKANNIDPKTVQFKTNMFGKQFLREFLLFNARELDRYDKPIESRDQDLLAFYLAYRNNAKGYVIDKFKEKFLKEAIEREDELYKKHYTLHPGKTLTPKLRKAVNSIYKEELSKV